MSHVCGRYDSAREVILSDFGEVIATEVKVIQSFLVPRRGQKRLPLQMMFAKCLFCTRVRSVSIWPKSNKAVIYV